MVKENSVVESEVSHTCGLQCLGPLTFHSQAVGNMIHLSRGCYLAERKGNTFRQGLVFSSRPVRVQERIHLRVEKDLQNWHGALRLGFTTVPPSDRPLPLPDMAIPNLTNDPGHWAAPVHESLCQAGSELKFWVSYGGSVYVASNNTNHKLLTGVDISKPIWAMIDIYGQTCSVFLLGSKKKGMFFPRRSCPVPECFTPPDSAHFLIPDFLSLLENSDDCISGLHTERTAGAGSVKDCVVCMGKTAKITLPCGHRCMCDHCGPKVIQQFGSCPLCRQKV